MTRGGARGEGSANPGTSLGHPQIADKWVGIFKFFLFAFRFCKKQKHSDTAVLFAFSAVYIFKNG